MKLKLQEILNGKSIIVIVISIIIIFFIFLSINTIPNNKKQVEFNPEPISLSNDKLNNLDVTEQINTTYTGNLIIRSNVSAYEGDISYLQLLSGIFYESQSYSLYFNLSDNSVDANEVCDININNHSNIWVGIDKKINDYSFNIDKLIPVNIHCDNYTYEIFAKPHYKELRVRRVKIFIYLLVGLFLVVLAVVSLLFGIKRETIVDYIDKKIKKSRKK